MSTLETIERSRVGRKRPDILLVAVIILQVPRHRLAQAQSDTRKQALRIAAPEPLGPQVAHDHAVLPNQLRSLLAIAPLGSDAATESTPSSEPGTLLLASSEEFPADATTTAPRATAAVIASCSSCE